jgi:hypothetical protein
MKRNWKKLRAHSLLNALELCVEHARAVKNYSVERIAEHMGEATHHSLYKWLAEGRLPLIKLRAFELACGADYVTHYLAGAAHKLLIDIPTGRPLNSNDHLALQAALNDACSALIRFYNGHLDKGAALTALAGGMEELAFNYHNLAKHDQPELELEP